MERKDRWVKGGDQFSAIFSTSSLIGPYVAELEVIDGTKIYSAIQTSAGG